MRKYDPIKHVLTGNMGGSVLTLGKTEQKGWRYTAICVHYDGANDAHTTLFTKYVTGRNAKYVNGDLCGRWDDGYGSLIGKTYKTTILIQIPQAGEQ